jgi:hypothetical protein
MRAAKLQMKPNITQLFAALDDSSDSEKSEQCEECGQCGQSEKSEHSENSDTSDFSSEYEEDKSQEQETQTQTQKNQGQGQGQESQKKEEYPKFRVWKTEGTEHFSALFHSKKPRLFSGEKQSRDPVTVFRAILSNQSVEETREKLSEEKEALAWAEKIKTTLEKAERQKYESRMSTGRISFFRKKIQLDEKF